MAKLKAAIIGCGMIAFGLERYSVGYPTTHSAAYKTSPGIELVAVQDDDAKKGMAIAKEHRLRCYRSIKELMESEKPDIVSVCTPDETHHAVLMEIARYPCVKGIWCEKPLASSVKQAYEMVKTCKAKGIRLLVNHQRRYDPFYSTVRERMQELLGAVQHVACYYSGGIVTAGSHSIDLLDMLFGRCRKVSAQLLEKPDRIHATLVYDHVTVTLIPCNGTTIFEHVFMGSTGKLETIDKQFWKYDYRYYVAQKDPRTGAMLIVDKREEPFAHDLQRDLLQRALADLIQSVKRGHDPICDGEAGLRSMETLSAIVASAGKDGNWMTVPMKDKGIMLPHGTGDIKKWKR